MKYIIEIENADDETFRRLMENQGYRIQPLDDDIDAEQQAETRRRLQSFNPDESVAWRDVRGQYVKVD